MTIDKMHASLLLHVDQDADFLRELLVPQEIDDFLNEAIRDFVNQQKRYLREELSVNQSSEAQENLHTLIASESITNISSHPIFADVSTVNLSDLTDYDYFISGRADFSGEEKILKPVASAYIVDQEKTKYDSPFNKGIPSAIEETTIMIRNPTGVSNPTEVQINYLQTPENVSLDSNTDSDLPEHTHRDIVRMAANNALQSFAGQTDDNE
jgi:hypothetical protein